MKLQFESFMASVGVGLINIFTPVIKVINFLLSKLLTVGNAFKALTELFTGKKSMKGSGIQETADAIGNLGEASDGAAGGAGNLGKAAKGAGKAADGAGKAAKKAAQEMKSLMGFDQINKLSDSSDSGDGGGDSGGSPGGSGGGGGGTPKGAEVDMGKIAEGGNQLDGLFDGLFKRLLELVKLFQNGFNASFRFDGVERLQSALKRIGELLQEIFTDPKVVASFQTMLDKIAYALGQFVGSIGTIALGIGVFIAESIANGLERQKERIKSALVSLFTNIGNVAEVAGNIVQAFSNGFYDVITSSGAVRIGSAIVSAFLSAGSTVIELGSKIAGDFAKGIEKAIVPNVPQLVKAWTGLLDGIAPVFESLESLVNDVGDALKRVYDDKAKPFIDSLTSGFGQLMKSFLDGWNTYLNPVLSKLGEKFSEVYDAHVKPAIDSLSMLLGSFFDFFKAAWEDFVSNVDVEKFMEILSGLVEVVGTTLINAIAALSDIISGLAQALSGLIDFVTGVFTGDWDLAWTGIKNLFSGIIKSLLAALGIDIDSMIAEFTRWWESVKTIFAPVVQWFKDKFKQAWDAIVAIFTGIGSWFSQRYNELKSNLASIPDWFNSKFREAYNNVKNAFSGIIGFFSGLWGQIRSTFTHVGTMVGSAIGGAVRSVINGVLGTVESTINSGISLLNGAISVINKLPGVNIGGFSYIGLPRLAQGGFVKANTPQIAMIGDNKHYGEIVAPENKMLEMARRAAELSNNGGGPESSAMRGGRL